MFDTPITQLERRHSFKSVEKKFAITLHSTNLTSLFISDLLNLVEAIRRRTFYCSAIRYKPKIERLYQQPRSDKTWIHTRLDTRCFTTVNNSLYIDLIARLRNTLHSTNLTSLFISDLLNLVEAIRRRTFYCSAIRYKPKIERLYQQPRSDKTWIHTRLDTRCFTTVNNSLYIDLIARLRNTYCSGKVFRAYKVSLTSGSLSVTT